MEPLLKVEGLTKYFPIRKGFLGTSKQTVKAVDGVSFTLEKGQTLGLVGESGCGKSTLGRCLLRLIHPTSGRVYLEGKNILDLGKKEMQRAREDMQMIFQDPFASLNPRRTVMETLLEPLQIHRMGTPKERRIKIEKTLELVGLRTSVLNRYPHEFSGGQRQRVGIARALVLDPKFIVADEPVSALDVSVQSQVLNLISDVQQKLGLSFLFIAHDLAVVQHISHVVAVMYLGKIVEMAPAEELYANPKHPYTQALLSAVPRPDLKEVHERTILSGDVPSPMNPPSGCPFHPRCTQKKPECETVVPESLERQGHQVSCHLYS